MEKKVAISVRLRGTKYGEPGREIEVIHRVLRFESIGNFNPIFCTYQNKKYLVQSLEGDISDPFRRKESYLNSLYIEIAFVFKRKKGGEFYCICADEKALEQYALGGGWISLTDFVQDTKVSPEEIIGKWFYVVHSRVFVLD